MAYKKHVDLVTDNAIALGGKDKNGKANPTSIEGYYHGSRPTPDKGYGPGVLHFFQTEKGMVGVWGKTNLNRIMTPDHRGQMCLVKYTGMGKASSGRKPAFNYELQYDEENTVEVAEIEVGASEPSYEDDVDQNYADNDGETELDAEEAPADEVPLARTAAPKKPLSTPTASSQKRVQDLLNRRSG